MISDTTIASIAANVRLSEVAGDYFPVKKRGGRFVALCPFHRERTPSFFINDDKGSYHCLAGDTIVQTWDGPRAIKDLAGSSHKILDGNGDWVVAPFFYLGDQETIEIHLKRNRIRKVIRATSDHRWFVFGRKSAVTTCELLQEHRIESIFPKQSLKIPSIEGIKHGIVMGDGCLDGKKSRVGLFGEKMCYRNLYFIEDNLLKYEYTYKNKQTPFYLVTGLPKEYKEFPSEEKDESYLLGFIAGLIATDGCVDKSGSVLLSNSSVEFLNKIRTICNRLGIVTYGINTQSRKGIKNIESEIHDIYFAQSTLTEHLILKPSAKKRFLEKKHPFTRSRWVVERIVRTGRIEPVFCASVDTTHTFCLDDNILTGNCFGCGAGGSVFRFVMEMDKISFPEAVRKLGAKAGIAIEEQESEADKLRRGLVSVVYKANQQFFSLLLSKDGADARKILKERGFNREICDDWKIGFAPKHYALSGNTDDHTLSGLTYDNGTLRFTNRIMFGIADESGTLVGFSGRTTDNHPAKYLNSPESSIFHKGKLLYGLDKAKRSIIDSGQAVIVEGQIDTIRCHLSGITNAVAPLGTGFTASHGATVRRLCGEAVLVFDGDKAGREASFKAFAGLASLGVKVKAVMLLDGDPDSFLVSGGNLASLISKAKLYPEALAESLDKDSIEDKQIAMGRVGQALSVLEDGIERDELANRCAKLLGIKSSQLKKQAAMGGGHRALPTETRYGEQKGESWKQLVAHLLLCGKQLANAYNWDLLADDDISTIMAADYEAGNPSSMAKIISQLDNNAEAAIQGISHQDIADLDIHSIYKSMLEAEIKRRTSMVDLMPLLDTLKGL